MTEMKSFVDTNVWFYALTEQNIELKAKAESLIYDNKKAICLSTQVINELCANLIRKASFSESGIKQLIARLYFDYEIIELDEEILLSASDLRTRYPFSFWDGLIVASALTAKVKILYSEDMQNNLQVENKLKIVNPF
ncbi:MAG: PIN domain-containing protein [Acidobacteriota bacterium]|nr:PIN domain-containing protein [Acidobacteriota bacterium]